MNKHGLSRDIPSAVKLEVRKLCGFGCVVCGAVPYDYDHFRIPFADAKSHDPDDIILLCDAHHRLKGAGLLDAEAIQMARKINGLDRECHFKLPSTSIDFKVHWPSISLDALQHQVLVNDESVLELSVREDELEPVLLSGVLSGRDGQEICRIKDNEFVSRPADLGDFTLIGNRFSYRSITNEKTLAFELNRMGLVISEIYFVRRGAVLFGNSRRFIVGNGRQWVDFAGAQVWECDIAISIRSAIPFFDYQSIDIETMVQARMPGTVSHSNAIGIGFG